MSELTERLANVKLVALDVDGTLTDGGIFYSASGDELRRFHVHDGLVFALARGVGLEFVWISGRRSELVLRRAKELKIQRVEQGVRDKDAALRTIASDYKLALEEIAFIGDDLNDLPAIAIAGVSLAPADAVPAVLATVDLVLTKNGGNGAVREAVEQILRARGDYEKAVQNYLETLILGQ
jgi:3-deoxy-D-manno-octulosonate 8-phosphate phosphatase (KDO 8-P phosphatase)